MHSKIFGAFVLGGLIITLLICGYMQRSQSIEYRPERTHYQMPAPELTDLSTQTNEEQYLFRDICPKKWHCTNLYLSHYPPKDKFVAGEFEFENRGNVVFRCYPEEIENNTPNRSWVIRAVQEATDWGKDYTGLQRPKK